MTDTKRVEDESDVLSRLVNLYESAEQSTADSRAEAERDRDYRNGIQWTEEEISTLKKRKQPIITIDRIGPKVDFLLGMESGNRTDPRAYPRTPRDEDAAHAATDALRFVMEDQRWDRTRSECFDDYLVEGACGVDVRVVDKHGEMCIEVLPIRWDRMFGDPHSRMRNWSDGAYKGQFLWMDLEDAVESYPDKEDILETALASESGNGDTYDDVPKTRWSDPKRRRVRLVEVWTKEKSTYFHTVFTKSGILSRQETPYVDEDGEPDDGFVFGSCNIDRDGNRFGVVRRWISLQDEINKRRSKALHLMNVRQTYGNQSVGDKNKLRTEIAKPDGHIEMAGGAKFGEDFGIVPTNDMAAAQFQLLQEAKSEIDAVGVNAALSGTESRVMSGRALQSRQEQGMNELVPVFDAFKQFQHDVYRKVWNRIKQFWTEEKWVRITDDEKNVKFVGLNQPLTLGEQLLEEFRASGASPEQISQAEQQAKMDPAMQQVVGVKNNVGDLDVDIVIDDVPASASLQGEQFETLAKLAERAGNMPPQMFEALVEASSLRNKDKILAKLKGEEQGKKSPKEAQLEQQLQEMQQLIEMANKKLEEAQRGERKTELEMTAKAAQLEIDQHRAETERIKVTQVSMSPEEVRALAMQAARDALNTAPLEPSMGAEMAIEDAADDPVVPQDPMLPMSQGMEQPPSPGDSGVTETVAGSSGVGA